ncbi:flagellar motor switch protein FliM [Methylovirgula ligni]|uniref:Flagellar motor switch protein FliM n=1 Tax=Methylovirgula ligni TaxID=569860 RepID=A0A3D9YWP4_9HYPH|nr:FliM/FliN family flagellar motor switch protein [Methylovirgula ligni]REF86121.1 flagellar motor switch protein FliM [Methylovirgula ligni]
MTHRGKASTEADAHMSAPERLFDSAGVSLDRMPMLRVIFDRLAMQCSENARQLSTAPAYFSVHSIKTERIGKILEAAEGKAVVAVLHVQAWDARIMVGLDNKLIFALVEALFGGDGSESPYIENRALTNIEMRVAQKAFDLITRALHKAFSVIEETHFKFERVETRMDFAVVAPRNNFAVLAKLNLRILGRAGEFFVAIPQAALNPIRQSLTADRSNDAATPDPRWSKQIKTEVGKAEVMVQAIIEEDGFTLGDIAALKVGNVLQLKATPKSRVKLECNSEPLFWCQLGQAEGKYTLRVDDIVDAEQEFLDGLVNH